MSRINELKTYWAAKDAATLQGQKGMQIVCRICRVSILLFLAGFAAGFPAEIWHLDDLSSVARFCMVSCASLFLTGMLVEGWHASQYSKAYERACLLRPAVRPARPGHLMYK
jgi:hypothetical protein